LPRGAAAHEGAIDLLLTDVIMPGKNGKELYDLLKRERPGLKALFMSGYSGDVIGRHGILGGEVQYLQKPFTAADLAREVRRALGPRRTGPATTATGKGNDLVPAGVSASAAGDLTGET